MKNIKLIIAAEIGVLVVVGLIMIGLFLYSGGVFGVATPPTAQPVVLPTETPVRPTATPIAVAIPGKSGTELLTLDDGSTKFADYDGLYEITFPAGWLVVRPGSQEFQDALANKTAKRPGLKDALESAQDMDPAVARVLAYDLKEGSVKTDMLGYIVVTWDQTDESSIDEELYKGIPQIEADSQYQGKGLRVVSTDTIETANQIKVGRIGTKWNVTNDAGDIVQIFMPINFFKVPKGTVFLMLTTLNDTRPDIEPDFKAIVDMVQLP
jgi:hypothetical protein